MKVCNQGTVLHLGYACVLTEHTNKNKHIGVSRAGLLYVLTGSGYRLICKCQYFVFDVFLWWLALIRTLYPKIAIVFQYVGFLQGRK